MLLGFIGAGKMAEAIFAGLLREGALSAADVLVHDVCMDRVRQLESKYGVKGETSSLSLVSVCNPIILSVKPQDLDAVLPSISDKVEGRCVISIAAGITTSHLEAALPGARVVRVMPNLACQVGAGMSVICGGTHAGEKDVAQAEVLFSSSGRVCRAPEDLFDMVTAISGSGPAFWTQLAQYEVGKAVDAGMDPAVAKALVLQTMVGTATVLQNDDLPFDQFMDAVASKGGTTAAGLAVLRKSSAKDILCDVLDAAAQRSYELRNPQSLSSIPIQKEGSHA